jgi:pimeloyl-ACP methyl ester carboxylesterase
VRPPEVSYARSGDVAIAYQIVGTGPPDLVFVRGTTGDLVSTWEQPLLVRHVEGLAESTRVLMLDKRGTGLSIVCARCSRSRRRWTTYVP